MDNLLLLYGMSRENDDVYKEEPETIYPDGYFDIDTSWMENMPQNVRDQIAEDRRKRQAKSQLKEMAHSAKRKNDMRKRQASHRDRLISLEENFWKYIGFTFLFSIIVGVSAGILIGMAL